MSSDEEEFVSYIVVAYRIRGEDGWEITETDLSLEEFERALKESGIAVDELRPIHDGLRRLRGGEPFKPDTLVAFDIHQWGWTYDESAERWRAPGENILPPPGAPAAVTSFGVEYGRPHDGWLPMKIRADEHEVSFDASEVFDPFDDLIEWLEKLSDGEFPRTVFDLEGSEYEFVCLSNRQTRFAEITGHRIRKLDAERPVS